MCIRDSSQPDSEPGTEPPDPTEHGGGSSRGATPRTRLDVVAVGNALVDVLGAATDEDLVALDLVKGCLLYTSRCV